MSMICNKLVSSYSKRRRATAALICGSLLCLLIMSGVYLVEEAAHPFHCHDEDCPICENIQQCQHNFQNLGSGVSLAVMVVTVVCGVGIVLQMTSPFTPCITLISEKVRLDN